jgi:hypothetical protein
VPVDVLGLNGWKRIAAVAGGEVKWSFRPTAAGHAPEKQTFMGSMNPVHE